MNTVDIAFFGVFCLMAVVIGKAFRILNARVNEKINLLSLYSVTSSNNLGLLEANFRSLKSIIIVNDNVEKPSDKLLEAVIKNAKKGIKYKFYISSRNYSNRDQYFSYFSFLKEWNLTDMVEIYSLDMDWDKSKYIFYEMDLDPKDVYKQVIGYRGEFKEYNVTVRYSLVQEHEAFLIAELLRTKIKELSNVSIWKYYTPELIQTSTLDLILEETPLPN